MRSVWLSFYTLDLESVINLYEPLFPPHDGDGSILPTARKLANGKEISQVLVSIY